MQNQQKKERENQDFHLLTSATRLVSKEAPFLLFSVDKITRQFLGYCKLTQSYRLRGKLTLIYTRRKPSCFPFSPGTLFFLSSHPFCRLS